MNPSSEAAPKRKGHNPFSKSGFLSANGSKSEDKKEKRKLTKKSSRLFFQLGSPPDTDHEEDETLSPLESYRSDSTRSRTKIGSRSRPGSVFGSLGKKSSYEFSKNDDPESVPPSPVDSEHEFASLRSKKGKNVLLHGEVQTTIGLFRKKKEYLVLTDTHFIRFKTQSRASEVFPSAIPPTNSRTTTTRHPSSASVGSAQDLQSLHSHASAEFDNAIPLEQIVAAYKMEEGKAFHVTDVVYLDEEHGVLGSVQLMLTDPKDSDLWHSSIRAAAQKARLLSNQIYPAKVIDYLVRMVENAMDYDANNFQVYRVVKRPPSKNSKNSSDDLKILSSNMSYMVIGINRLHLISLPDYSEASHIALDIKASRQSFGLVTLVSVDVRYSDDTFELGFRQPLQAPVVLDLAAAAAPEIVSMIHKSILFLKPQWLDYTFLYGGPPEVLDDNGAPLPTDDDNGWFDRTLVAYCMAYNANPGRIRYAIDHSARDAPEFQLLAPESKPYSTMELLSVLRALRFNEMFHSISFNGVNLHSLYNVVDNLGRDHVAQTSRTGVSLRKYSNVVIEPLGKSLLYQELQALALKAKQLKRIDLGHTLPKRRVRDTFDEDGAVDTDPGCEVVAALLPLCRIRATSVDWIILNGIELGEADIEEIVLALNDYRHSKFRSIEVSRCALADRGMQLLLGAMEHQSAIECLNISDNPGRLHLERFSITMSRFQAIKRLDLSRVTCSSGAEPLINAEVLLSWRLEEFILTGLPINESTLNALAMYLANPMSSGLCMLQMDQCNLTGGQVATLMRSMCSTPGVARNMHLHVSANRLEKGNSEIVKAIEEDCTPTQLTMRMVEYSTESRFRHLLQALRRNSTIRALDISKASLPTDASEDTCKALRAVFEENTTLEELDISGEQAHLETARFGIGLSAALAGLRKNSALKILKIEYQNLGLEGANTLSSVLERNNSLEQIFCEHNEINLQGFTMLINALANNFTVLYLPEMREDRSQAVRSMANQAVSEPRASNTSKLETKTKASVRKTLNTIGMTKSLKADHTAPTAQDVEMAIQVLNTRWDKQVERMTDFIQRNYRFQQGLETPDSYREAGGDEFMRPMTATSEAGIMEHVLSHTTPRIELGNPLEVERRRLSVLHMGDENNRYSMDGTIHGSDGAHDDGEGSVGYAHSEWRDARANDAGSGTSPLPVAPCRVHAGSVGSAFRLDADLVMNAAMSRAFELGGISPDDSPSGTPGSSSVKS